MAINIRSLRVWLAALVAAMSLGLLTSASAHALSLETGHVDIVYTDINNGGTKLSLGTWDEERGNWYQNASEVSSLEFVVPKAAWGVKTAGVATLLQDQEEAKEVPELEAGFAGSGDEDPLKGDGLRDWLEPGKHNVILELTNVTTPTGGAFSIVRNGTATWFDSKGDKTNFGISKSGDEGFHLHSDWNFTKAGKYGLTFKASTNKAGVAASEEVTYTFDVKAPN